MPSTDTQFKQGISGNPSGRPSKGYSITDTIRDMVAAGPEIKRKLVKKILEKALAGDLKAIELIWAYMDGKPVQTSNVSIVESPAEKVKRTIALIQKARKDGLLSSGNSGVLQEPGGSAGSH